MGFVLIKRFDNSIDAHLFRISLENEGIECFLVDEEIVTINPLYANAVGGIKAKVREADVERTLIFLKSIEKEQIPKCPSCGSTDIFIDYSPKKALPHWIASLFSLLTVTYPITGKIMHSCKACGERFRQ
jgi:hypothetical protein